MGKTFFVIFCVTLLVNLIEISQCTRLHSKHRKIQVIPADQSLQAPEFPEEVEEELGHTSIGKNSIIRHRRYPTSKVLPKIKPLNCIISNKLYSLLSFERQRFLSNRQKMSCLIRIICIMCSWNAWRNLMTQ
jgi:hypothetical protein